MTETHRGFAGHLDDLLIHVILMGMGQVSVVEVVDMTIVLDARVAALRVMLVGLHS